VLADLTSCTLLVGLQQAEYLEDGLLKKWNAYISSNDGHYGGKYPIGKRASAPEEVQTLGRYLSCSTPSDDPVNQVRRRFLSLDRIEIVGWNKRESPDGKPTDLRQNLITKNYSSEEDLWKRRPTSHRRCLHSRAPWRCCGQYTLTYALLTR
jgi:hypothetical protein